MSTYIKYPEKVKQDYIDRVLHQFINYATGASSPLKTFEVTTKETVICVYTVEAEDKKDAEAMEQIISFDRMEDDELEIIDVEEVKD